MTSKYRMRRSASLPGVSCHRESRGGFDDLCLPEEPIRAALSWTGCVVGALSVDACSQMLKEAGFKEPNITMKYRYLRDDPSALSETLRALTEEQQRALLSRICSADITAVKAP